MCCILNAIFIRWRGSSPSSDPVWGKDVWLLAYLIHSLGIYFLHQKPLPSQQCCKYYLFCLSPDGFRSLCLFQYSLSSLGSDEKGHNSQRCQCNPTNKAFHVWHLTEVLDYQRNIWEEKHLETIWLLIKFRKECTVGSPLQAILSFFTYSQSLGMSHILSRSSRRTPGSKFWFLQCHALWIHASIF